MLDDLDHPYADGEEVYDVTFENVQAGLRTDYLFRLANHRGGIVLGTGDLSELALGWCTYGVGDQMSHYDVNAGVPKTLIQHLIRWVDRQRRSSTRRPTTCSLEILDQEITPELVPTGEGEQPQATEDSVGPYSLQDFTLFHVLRRGYRPQQDRVPRLARLARRRRRGVAAGLPRGRAASPTTSPTIRHWLEVFVRAVLRQPVQALRAAQRPQGRRRRDDVARAATGGCRRDASAAAWLAELEPTSRTT